MNLELDQRVAVRTAELEVARTQAELARSASSRFLANVSHQLRTPVNGIEGMLELLAASDMPPTERGWIESAAVSAERLSRLLIRLITYVDLEQRSRSEMATGATEILLAQALEQIVATWMKPALRAGKLLTFDNELPTGYVVRLDQELVKQLLDELIANAIEHADAGPIRLRAMLRASGSLVLVVADPGPGIPDDTFTSLLEPFRRGDESTTTTSQGSGLGLGIASLIARFLGMTLAVGTTDDGQTSIQAQLAVES